MENNNNNMQQEGVSPAQQSKSRWWIAIVLGVIALALLVFFVLTPCKDCGVSPAENENGLPDNSLGQQEDRGEREVSGTVVENDKSQVPVDGPGILVVRNEFGQDVKVYYTSGMMPCKSNASDVGWNIEPGAQVVAYGKLAEDGSIALCESADYSLQLK